MGLTSLIITLAVCVAITVFAIKKPMVTVGFLKFNKKPLKLESYYLIALLAPVLLLIVGAVSPLDIFEGITAQRAVNPLKILALFLSMCFISVCLDKAGFFEYCAAKALKNVSKGMTALFTYFYFFIAVLTVFTSNDIIILAFTPFICYFCRSAKISPLPFIAAEFAAANTFSIMLVIGNPTNIYIAAYLDIAFFEYLKVMALPALCAGLAAYAALRVIFAKTLKAPIALPEQALIIRLKDKSAAILSAAALALCIVLMSISGFWNVEMWIISLCSAAALALALTALKLLRGKDGRSGGVLIPSVKGLPYGVIPFLLSMFAAVLALEKHGVTAHIAALLPKGDSAAAVFGYGFISAAAANILNNIPMSVLFASVVSGAGGAASAAYASIIGSNLGALISPSGALAGIMLLNLLKDKDTGFDAAAFIKYLAPAAVVSLAAALAALTLTLGV